MIAPRPRRERGRAQTGFSLVEILVSISILAAIVGIYAISSDLILLSRTAQEDDVALRVATSKLEALRAVGYGSLPPSGTFTDPLLTASFSSSSAYMTVTAYNAKTKRVDVTVYYQDKPVSPTRSITLTTLMTDIGGL